MAATTLRESPLVRLAHVGDLHLGPNARNPDRIRALDQIIDECLRAPLDGWLWPGDLNHALMTVHDKNILTSRTIRMANHAPVIIVPGNHDWPGDLDFLAKLAATYPIYVITSPQVVRVPLVSGVEAAIFCFPYPSRMGLVGAGVPSDLIVSAAREKLDVYFILAAAQLAAAAAEGAIPLMIGHVNVGGSVLSAGQPNIGREIELDPTMLARLGPIYKGLNHIHKAQAIAGAIYAGSCCRLDWGEIEEKRYLTIEYSRLIDNDPDSDWMYTVESHPIAVPPRYLIVGTLTREGFEWSCEAAPEATQAGPGFFTNTEVKVTYTFVVAERDVLDFSLVKAPFVGARRIDLDPIPTHTRAIRAPEIAKAVTLEEKVAAYFVSAGETWTEALAAKLALMLQPQDDARFYAAVTADLAALAIPLDVEEPMEAQP